MVWDHEAAGSRPATPTKIFFYENTNKKVGYGMVLNSMILNRTIVTIAFVEKENYTVETIMGKTPKDIRQGYTDEELKQIIEKKLNDLVDMCLIGRTEIYYYNVKEAK